MTAPGDNLEFFESEYFSHRLEKAGPIRQAVLEHLKSWPRSGLEIAGGVKELAFKFGGKNFAVFFRRQANRIGLMYVFELPKDFGALEEQKTAIRKRYSGGKP